MKYDYSVVFQKAWEIMSIEYTKIARTTSITSKEKINISA